jgi:hypothetical protein
VLARGIQPFAIGSLSTTTNNNNKNNNNNNNQRQLTTTTIDNMFNMYMMPTMILIYPLASCVNASASSSSSPVSIRNCDTCVHNDAGVMNGNYDTQPTLLYPTIHHR